MLYYLKTDDSGLYECELPDGRRDQVRLVVRNPNEPSRPDPEDGNSNGASNCLNFFFNF